jgi:hypothetical protein
MHNIMVHKKVTKPDLHKFTLYRLSLIFVINLIFMLLLVKIVLPMVVAMILKISEVPLTLFMELMLNLIVQVAPWLMLLLTFTFKVRAPMSLLMLLHLVLVVVLSLSPLNIKFSLLFHFIKWCLFIYYINKNNCFLLSP